MSRPFNCYLIYGVPFRWKEKIDWIPIYNLMEEGEYSSDPLQFLSELSNEDFEDDLDSYDNYPEGRVLNERYALVKHQSSGMLFVYDREHFCYLSGENWMRISDPGLYDYQNFVVFLNKNSIKVDFREIGMYIVNDSFTC